MANNELKDRREQRKDALWTGYHVALRFRKPILGGVPQREKLYQEFTARKGGTEENVDGLPGIGQEAEGPGIPNTFRRNEEGAFCLHGLQIRAMLKDMGARTGLTKIRGVRAALQGGGLQISPELIPLFRDGKPITAADGQEVYGGQPTGPQGPRSVITCYDRVEAPADVEFTVRVLRKDIFNRNRKGGEPSGEEILFDLFVAGEDGGLGSARQMDFGKFELVRFDPVEAEAEAKVEKEAVPA